MMEYLACILFTGAGATAATDVWSAIRSRLFKIPPPDYGMVGRWLAHMLHGTFRHDSIGKAARMRGELAIGWIAHYVIGIGYAGVLFTVWGFDWIEHPTLVPALIVGIATVTAPFFLMQPGMGAGIAASRTPKPNASRIQSLLMHAAFGLGMYVTGWIANLVFLN